tara:strand:+ start:236 stop:337 length:102 start_codon:yes stop_codon:yes gene_type:complete
MVEQYAIDLVGGQISVTLAEGRNHISDLHDPPK